MTDSQSLLAEYARNGSDAAFRELVTRYVDLVYSTALRLVEGDTHRAEDVAQNVFADLARNARALPKNVKLGGWLHRDTCFVAGHTLRSERRRQSRERQAVEMNVLQNDSGADFSQVAPILDEAINELGEADRTAILLRFFEQHDFRSVGQALGSTEDAARMRVTRALEKLELLLKRRGVTASSSALAVVLGANAVQAAPVGLAVTISTAATLAGTTIATAGAATAIKALAMTTMQKTVIGITLAAAVGTGVYEARQASNARAEAETLRQQQAPLTEQIQRLTHEKDDMSRRLTMLQTKSANAKRRPTLAEIKAKIRDMGTVDWTQELSQRRRDDWQQFAALIDPADFPATAALLEQANSMLVRGLWQDWMTKWAKADPSAAMAYAQTITDEASRRQAIYRVMQGWVEIDSSTALAWAQQLPVGGQLRTEMLGVAIGALASKDPQAAFDLMKSTGQNIPWRWGGMQDLFGTWAEKDPTAAIKAAESLSGLQRARALQGIRQSSWASKDPQAAIAWANSLPEGNDKLYAIHSIAQQWAYSDINSAAAWVQQLPEGRVKQSALDGFPADKWAKTDPDAAMAFAQSLKGDAQNNFLQTIANTLGNTDPTKAMEWANRLPEGIGRNAFIAAMAGGMAQNSPQEAANYVSKLPAGETQNRAVLTVVSSLANSDPQAAAAWVSAFPASATRNQAIGNVIDKWSRNDPTAAGNWLATLPADQSQQAIQRYVSDVAFDYPELAAPWVETILNPKQRNSAIEDIAKQWLKTDPAAAQAWLAKTSLPDERKQRLLAILNKQ